MITPDICSASYVSGWRAGYRRCCGRTSRRLIAVWVASGVLLLASLLLTWKAVDLALENTARGGATAKTVIGKWEAWWRVQ